MPVAAIEGESEGQTIVAALHSLPSPMRYGNLPDQWWSLGMERVADNLPLPKTGDTPVAGKPSGDTTVYYEEGKKRVH